MATPIQTTFFGLTIESPGYNYGYYGGPVETTPTIPFSVARSWDVWSPGNGQIAYLDWSDLNPSAGVYNWSALNSWIALNQATNTQMVYTFGNPPAWAGGITTNLADFQAFVTAVVTQANGAIHYWEGFNEFDVSGIAPALMVQLQEIIYNTVHKLDPGAVVLSPTVSSAAGDPLFGQFLADGGGQYFDVAAFHGYNNSTGEGIVSVVQGFQAVLSQYGLSNVPIWDTEWGMEAPTVITNTTAQEAYVSTGLILQAALGVQTEIFYAYDSASSALYNTSTGQLTAAGVAFQVTEQWLSGATEPTGYQQNGSVYTVQLTKGGASDVLVWDAAGQATYSAGNYTQYVDVLGQVHAIVNGVVNIGTTPILLETPTGAAIDATVPPAPSIVSFSPDTAKVGDGITDATVLTLTGTAEANSTVAVFDGKTELGTAAVNSSGAWSFTTGTLANGTHAFATTDTDAAGTSLASSVLAVTVDTTPPKPAFANLVHNSNGTMTLSGTSEANSSVSIYDGTTDLGTVTTSANGAWTFTIGKLSTAVHSFTLTAVDVAGNVGNGSNVALYGPANHETINVGPANDIVSVLGGGDTFAFGSSFGNDVITGFQATGSSQDILQFSHNSFSNFAAVLAHATQVGSSVVITMDAADTVTLTNTHLSSLQKTDIHIV